MWIGPAERRIRPRQPSLTVLPPVLVYALHRPREHLQQANVLRGFPAVLYFGIHWLVGGGLLYGVGDCTDRSHHGHWHRLVDFD